jgi:endonuclease/exonuclease/phosphatase family metal-dependent hydrolase
MPASYTLMTWNILHGGGPLRLPEIALALLEIGPDVVLLSEFRAARGGQLAGVLHDHGWVHQHQTTHEHTGNGLLLAARTPVAWTDAPPPPCVVRPKWLEVHLPELDLTLAGVHIPHRGSGTARTMLWKHAVERARAHKEGRFMLFGDMNTGRNRADGPAGAFDCTARLGELASMRYIDAWRHFHPQSREGTWAGHGSAAHRIDHAHLSEAVFPDVLGAWHETGPLTRGLSDHAALLVQLGARTSAGVV